MSRSTNSILTIAALVVCALTHGVVAGHAMARPIRLAVIGFGDTPLAKRTAEQFQKLGVPSEFVAMDPDQTSAAAKGAGYTGSLNLTLEDARNLGAAIGCDFFIVGEAQTLRRSPSAGPIYFESYASVFLVSARTGKLAFWERQEMRRPAAIEAEQALLSTLGMATKRFQDVMRRVAEAEREARARAIDANTPVIEIMSDNEVNTDVRPPRPYRRLKPPYPPAAAHDNVEAIVDALVDIDAKGNTGHIEIARWAGYGLDESVINTVRQLQFFPAMRDGVAIPMRVLLRYNFRKPPANKD